MRSLLRRTGAFAILATLTWPLPAAPPARAGNASPSRAQHNVRFASRAPLRVSGARAADVGILRPSTLGSGRDSWDPSAPVPSFGFDAIPRVGADWPADPTGALGENWFLAAVNVHYALYDLSGTPVLGPARFAPFFTLPAGTQVFDPKVIYDQYDHEFVLAFVGANDGLRKSWVMTIAIPDATASDKSTWCSSKISSDLVAGDGKQWADYPGLGYDANRVTITTNQFGFPGSGGFAYAQILSFPKTSLYDCSAPIAFDSFTGAETRNPDASKGFSIQPATSIGGSPGNQYLLSFEKRQTGSNVIVWRVKPSATGTKLAKAALPVSEVSLPQLGTQGGGSLTNPDTWWDTGDLRFVNAFYDADLGKVYAAHAITRDLKPDTATGGYPESVIRWYEVQPAGAIGSSLLTRKGIVGTAETDAGWPAVATDGAGNLFVTYSRASQPLGEFLSAWAAEIVPGATTATIVELVPGTARMEALSGVERWGDFNAVNRDPLDPAFVAMFNQYAKSDGSGPSPNWQETADVVGHV